MQVRPVSYNISFAGKPSNVKAVETYFLQIHGKPVSEIRQGLLDKIAKAKAEGKRFEIGMLEDKARALGIIK